MLTYHRLFNIWWIIYVRGINKQLKTFQNQMVALPYLFPLKGMCSSLIISLYYSFKLFFLRRWPSTQNNAQEYTQKVSDLSKMLRENRMIVILISKSEIITNYWIIIPLDCSTFQFSLTLQVKETFSLGPLQSF